MPGKNITVTIKKPKQKGGMSRKTSKRYKRYRRSYFAGPKYIKALRAADPDNWNQGNPYSLETFGPTYKEASDIQKLARRAMAYKGAGDYRSVGKYLSRGIGGIAGGALGYMNGGLSGAGAGAQRGWNRGADFSKWMGWGDYGPMTTNAIMNPSQQNISVNAGDASGDVFISHTEFVGNVTCSTGGGVTSTPFQITAYDLNPGVTGTFKWLSQIAQNYELYDWMGLIFQFKPTSGEFGASAVSNALGKVVMCTRYGVNQTAGFANSIEMQNYDYANSSKPSCGMGHGVETANRQQVTGEMNVIRTGPPTDSRILYDVGQFYIATEGIPLAANTTAIIGELWVSYRVRLSRAKLYQSVGDDILGFFATTTPIPANFGNSVVLDTSNTLGATISASDATSLTVTFPQNIFQGTFMLQTFVLSAAAQNTFTMVDTTNLTNCTAITDYYAPGISRARMPNANSTTAVYTVVGYQQPFNISAPGNLQASFKINITAAVPVGTHTCFIQINQIDSDLANNA